MICEALKKYNLDRTKCFMIGDKQSDLEAAKNAEIKGFLFDSNNLKHLVEEILNHINN